MADTKRFKKRAPSGEKILTSFLYGFISGIAMMLVLTLIFSALSLKFKNPIDMYKMFSVLSVALSAFLGGIISSFTYKKNPFLSSLFSTGTIGIILLMTNINNNETLSIINLLFMPLLAILCGLLGSVIYKVTNRKTSINKYIK